MFPSGTSYWSVLNDGASLPKAYRAGHGTRQAALQRAAAVARVGPREPGVQPPAVQLIIQVPTAASARSVIRSEANGNDASLLIAPAEAQYPLCRRERASSDPIGSADADGKFTIDCSGRSCDGRQFVS